MEVLYGMLYLVLVGKAISFNFGSLLQTLPPSVPEDFKIKIQEMYSNNPEAFGDSIEKGKFSNHIMKLSRSKKMHKTRKDSWSTKQQTTSKPDVSTTMPMMQMMPLPMPFPMPMPMYPQIPQIVPMRTYYERVKHDHPPLSVIRRMIQRDEERWENRKKVKHHKHSSSYEMYTSQSSEDDSSIQYYDDVIKIRGS